MARVTFPKANLGASLAVQWLRRHASIAGGAGLIPGWGTKIPHAAWPKNRRKKKKSKSSYQSPVSNPSVVPVALEEKFKILHVTLQTTPRHYSIRLRLADLLSMPPNPFYPKSPYALSPLTGMPLSRHQLPSLTHSSSSFRVDLNVCHSLPPSSCLMSACSTLQRFFLTLAYSCSYVVICDYLFKISLPH